MPGRKSNVSTTSNGPEEVADSTSAKVNKDKEGLSIEDLSLPKSMIGRLAKGVLPANTQIHKDALLAFHKSATVFVSYIASNSNDNAQASGKKTISPQDVIAALKDAELGEFLPRLEAELKKYNDTQCDKRNTYRRKVKEEKAAAAVKDEVTAITPDDDALPETNGGSNGHVEADDRDVERPMKKAKRDDGNAAIPHAQEAGDEDDDENDENTEDHVDEQVNDEDGEDETDAEEDVDEDEDEEEDDDDDDDDNDSDDGDNEDDMTEDPLGETDGLNGTEEDDMADSDSD